MNAGEDVWLYRAGEREVDIQQNRDFDANSFEDSERFEGDSECDSYGSVSEEMNWDFGQCDPVQQVYNLENRRPRSGRISVASDHSTATLQNSPVKAGTGNPLALSELAARCCARHLAFYQLESTYVAINDLKRNQLFPYLKEIDHLPISDSLPDKFFLSVVFYCFPSTAHDIRLYSVLANGRPVNYNEGEILYSAGSVTEVVQIGYLITAVVSDDVFPAARAGTLKGVSFNVSLKVDRCRVIYCCCNCGEPNSWCRHIVALALYRINQPHLVQFRVTVWDAVNELSEFKLKKFAQYLINELPREYLPVAQKLLDQLKDPNSSINCSIGAPDPTDGGHDPMALYSFDEANVHERVRKRLGMYCIPKAAVHSIDELGSVRHVIAQEFQKYLSPFVNLEPLALFNFLKMIRCMMIRKDSNAITLLRIVTEECLANRLVLLHWYVSKLLQNNKWYIQSKSSDDSYLGRQLHTAQLCDEIVTLWRHVVLNPTLSRECRDQFFCQLQKYHQLAAERVFAIIKSTGMEPNCMIGMLISNIQSDGEMLSAANARFDLESFPGFHSAMKVCVALPDLEIPGIRRETNFSWLKWSETTVVPLLPEVQFQISPAKRKSKKKKRRGGRRENRPRRHRRRDESSESGQESDQDDQLGIAPISFPSEDVASVLAESYTQMDPFDLRFAHCEAAFAHGYTKQAVHMALDLTKHLLSHNESRATDIYECLPSTSAEPQPFSQLRARSQARIDTLEKSLYLANILLTQHSERHISSATFRFVTKVLQFSKFPMTTKYQQVKEHYLEAELLKVLQKVVIGEQEVNLLRDAAARIAQIVDGGGIPPLGLAKFVFEALSYPAKLDGAGQPHPRDDIRKVGRQPEDDEMALGTALCALGAKLSIADTDYPMLHESLRIQKGHLALTLLCSFKDCREKLGLILDRLLDPQVHLMYSKSCSNATFLLREAVIQKRCLKGQRPQFPYPPKRGVHHQNPQNPPTVEVKLVGAAAEEIQQPMENLSIRASQKVDPEQTPPSNNNTTTRRAPTKRYKVRSFNTATEALSSFMWDLAKRVLHVAGGNSSSVVFAPIHPSTVTSRNLHICSLLISLYALGLHNKTRPMNWKQRSYSSEVSWIMQQIPEIGSHAYEIIREINWDMHFTPSELAGLSEKTMQTQVPQATRESALLALSVLPMAHMLQSQEAKSALQKCKDQGSEMMERACEAVMQSLSASGNETQSDRISSEVLFQVARYWEELHKEKDAFSPPHLQQQPQQQQQHIPMVQPPQLHHMMSHPPPPLPPNAMQFRQHHYGVPAYPMPPAHYQVPHSPPVYPPPNLFNPMIRPPSMLQAPPPPEANRLHQSHSAPQLAGAQAQRVGGDSFSPRLMKAFRAGLAGLVSIGRSQNDISRNHFTRHSPFKDDIEWLCGIALGLGEKIAFEFFEAAAIHVTCPYALTALCRQCYQLNLYCYNKGMPAPPLTNRFPIVQQQQQLKTGGKIRQACYETGRYYYFPITVELFEKCIEQFYKAIATRLSYASFNDTDRSEAESLLNEALVAFDLIPHQASTLDQFMHHIKKQKNWKKEMSGFMNNYESQLRSLYQQKMGYGNMY